MLKQVLKHHTTISFAFLGLITTVAFILAEIIHSLN